MATRTETLVAEIAHKELLADILQDIARMRLAGREDRARLTNEFLVRAEVSGAEFDTETSEVGTRIQQYLDFNDELLYQIDLYHQNIRTRLEETQAKLEVQYEQLEAIEGKTVEVLEETPTPRPEGDA